MWSIRKLRDPTHVTISPNATLKGYPMAMELAFGFTFTILFEDVKHIQYGY